VALITAVEVTNFRSLREVHLTDLTAADAIVGPNNSGKSNLLRALNLFFNDEVEPDEPLDLSVDHYSPWRKRKKGISISVKFDLHRGFTFGKRYQAAEELLRYEPEVKRIWAYDKSGEIVPRFAIYDGDKQDFTLLDEDQARVVRSFLGLFKFRYIPNHVHPSELIDMEQDDLQRNLVRRLRSVLSRRKKKAESPSDWVDLTPTEEMFTTLSQLAGQAIRPIAQALTEASGEIESIELDIAQRLDELVFIFGYFMKITGGDRLPATLQGSGVQAHLAYQVIHFLDTSFGQYFGNRQTVIWGVEEPESFLHTRLEYYLAQFLLERAASQERFQIFCTTHSDIFTRLATTGILVQLIDGESRCEVMEPRDLVRKAPTLGISRFVHALLYDLEPLILVEGKTDKMLLESAYSITDRKQPGTFHCLETLVHTGKTGGVNDLLKYLQQNRAAVNSRPLDSPILVVLDWEVKDKSVEEYEKALTGHSSSEVLRCDVALANPQLGDSFLGIERFLSTRVIQHAGQEGWLVLRRPVDGEYPLDVTRRSLKDGKTQLAEYMCAEGTVDDFLYLIEVTNMIDAAVRHAVGEVD